MGPSRSSPGASSSVHGLLLVATGAAAFNPVCVGKSESTGASKSGRADATGILLRCAITAVGPDLGPSEIERPSGEGGSFTSVSNDGGTDSVEGGGSDDEADASGAGAAPLAWVAGGAAFAAGGGADAATGGATECRFATEGFGNAPGR